MSKTRFRIVGRLEMASLLQAATVTIDRETSMLYVRPLRRRKEYCMPLSEVAAWVVRSTIRAELAAKRAAKKAKKR